MLLGLVNSIGFLIFVIFLLLVLLLVWLEFLSQEMRNNEVRRNVFTSTEISHIS